MVGPILFRQDVDAITALEVSVFRAPNCDYEYNTDDSSTTRIGDVDIVEDVWPVPTGMSEIIYGVAHMYGNFDIIFDHFSRISQLHPAPHAACAML